MLGLIYDLPSLSPLFLDHLRKLVVQNARSCVAIYMHLQFPFRDSTRQIYFPGKLWCDSNAGHHRREGCLLRPIAPSSSSPNRKVLSSSLSSSENTSMYSSWSFPSSRKSIWSSRSNSAAVACSSGSSEKSLPLGAERRRLCSSASISWERARVLVS